MNQLRDFTILLYNFDDICVYCTGDVSPWSNTEEFYPQCDDCADKPHIANVKKS